jgi:hypothetical protein
LIHDFEDIFLSAGGVRCWSGERITSPLVLNDNFAYYRKWCRVKAEIDPDLVNSLLLNMKAETATVDTRIGCWVISS